MGARRRAGVLTRDRVCAAALELVDDEGLEALSMRRLAARLDCEAMSLYNHVRDKADLLDAVHAAVLGGLQPETPLDAREWDAASAPESGATPSAKPGSTSSAKSGAKSASKRGSRSRSNASANGDSEPDDVPKWRRLLGGLARALRTALLAHPNVVPLFTTQRLTAPEAVHTVARVQMALAFSHFSEADAERALYVVGMFTIGHAIFEKSTRNDATFEFGLEALLDAVARDHRSSRRDDE